MLVGARQFAEEPGRRVIDAPVIISLPERRFGEQLTGRSCSQNVMHQPQEGIRAEGFVEKVGSEVLHRFLSLARSPQA